MAEIQPPTPDNEHNSTSCSPSPIRTPDAERPDAQVPATASECVKRGGRRPKFTPDDDLIIAREVAAARAHIAGYGEIKTKFTEAAAMANLNQKLSQKVSAKSIQDRYKKIQDAYDRRDVANRRLSGVGGEIGELDELLTTMAEARNDMGKEKQAEKAAQEEKEARKERIGTELVARSLVRKRSSSGEDDVGVDGDSEEEPGSGRKRRRRVLDVPCDDLESFGNALKEADLVRIEMEEKRLVLERERMAAEREERKKDRELRREEQKAQNELELEKFKLLMGAFTAKK